MPAANSASRWASCRHAETSRDHTLSLYDFAPVRETTHARLSRGFSSQLMRTGTFHRPRPLLYHFALAMALARYLANVNNLD